VILTEKRTQEFEKRETERVILEALVRADPFNPHKRRLRFTELLDKTNLGRTTLNRALKRMQSEGKVARHVEAPVGKAVEIYYGWGHEAEKIYPLVPTRKHYEELEDEFSVKIAPGRYIRKLEQALGKTLIPVLLESLRHKTPILAEPVLREFKFLIGKYVLYRKNPDTVDARDVMRMFRNLEEHPEEYEEELKELENVLKKGN